MSSAPRISAIKTRAARSLTRQMPRVNIRKESQFSLCHFFSPSIINWPSSLYMKVQRSLRWHDSPFLFCGHRCTKLPSLRIIVGTLINNINVAYDCDSFFFFLFLLVYVPALSFFRPRTITKTSHVFVAFYDKYYNGISESKIKILTHTSTSSDIELLFLTFWNSVFNVSNRACIIESNYIYTICVQDKNYARQFIVTFHRPWTFNVYFTLTRNVARTSCKDIDRGEISRDAPCVVTWRQYHFRSYRYICTKRNVTRDRRNFSGLQERSARDERLSSVYIYIKKKRSARLPSFPLAVNYVNAILAYIYIY